MDNYKVRYVECALLTKKTLGFITNEGSIDGLTLSKEVEALLQEQYEQGFEMVNMIPINGVHSIEAEKKTITSGVMITFKKR